MRIAILGATSQIALDYITSVSTRADLSIVAFARANSSGIKTLAKLSNVRIAGYETLSALGAFDVVLNFVGTGNPAAVSQMGNSILDVTSKYDDLALELASLHSDSKYIFMSSGVAYGHDFRTPATRELAPINSFNLSKPGDAYGYAKFLAETRHRSFGSSNIYDLRIFGYFNHSVNLDFSFFLTDVVKAILGKYPLKTSSGSFIRDYINASDFVRLISAIIDDKGRNVALDAFTDSPVEKFELLEALGSEFGLKTSIADYETADSPTGTKPMYFSTNYRAKEFGYFPAQSSLENIVAEVGILISRLN